MIKTLKYLGLIYPIGILSILIFDCTPLRATPVYLPSWQSMTPPTLMPKSKLLEHLPSGSIIRSVISPTLSRSTLIESNILRRHMRSRAPQRRAGLMIIGDSLSATDHFIRCMTKLAPPLTKWTNIIQSWSSRGPFSVLRRESYSAQHGATTWELLKPSTLKPKGGYGYKRAHINDSTASPSEPLLKELYHNQARYASVLLGTNDLYYHKGLERFVWRYIQIIESLLSAGVMPIVQTLPPQTSRLLKNPSLVHTFNRAIRAIAYAERVPLLDLYEPLSSLTHQGLRKDGIHLSAYAGGCRLNKQGLRFGHNLRNKLFLSAYRSISNLNQDTSAHVQPVQQTVLSPIIVSKVLPSSTVFTHHHACWSKAMTLAQKSQRWRRQPRSYRERQASFVGPPVESYGTWRMESTALSIHKHSLRELLSFLSPGMKRDLSREQAWLHLTDGRCIHLGRNTQYLRLASGTHHLIHLARLEPFIPHKIKAAPSIQPYGRAILSW